MKVTLRHIGLSVSTAAITAASLISSAWAANFGGPSPALPGLATGTDVSNIRTAIINIITTVLNFLALIAVIMVLIAGIRLIVSQGEDEAKDKVKKTIIYALIGLIVVLFARVLVALITNYLATQVS